MTDPIKTSELARTAHDDFTAGMDILSKDAESLRLLHMRRHLARENIALTFGLISVLLGAGGFGWFFLVKIDLLRALGAITLGTLLPLLCYLWAARTFQAYKEDYKIKILPRMGKLLGGLHFYRHRGISATLLKKTGILPAHDIYNAEDCFIGQYKGAKIILSEARLYTKKNRAEAVFSGLFVLLEIPQSLIEGHTIITADRKAFQHWRPTRWQKLQDIPLPPEHPAADRFYALSSAPEAASLLIGERFLKELSEAADIFDKSPLTLALFGGKFIFIMIPCTQDMFEPSTIHFPVTTRVHALQCKHEIEQLLEIIDIFDLYKVNPP